jgi:cell division protease FtsH
MCISDREYPSEKAQSFEEAKRALEKKEAEKIHQEEQMLADDESQDSLPAADGKAENESENQDTDTEEK